MVLIDQATMIENMLESETAYSKVNYSTFPKAPRAITKVIQLLKTIGVLSTAVTAVVAVALEKTN